MNRALLVTACVFLWACTASRSPEAGSQTHFLKACDASCPAPYSCLCGVCSLTCSSEAKCGEQAEGAKCVPVVESCISSSNICDVTCDSDRDCRSLGSNFSCEAGRCRTEDSVPDAGTAAAVCEAYHTQVASYVKSHASCAEDWDCALAGSCSSGFGFEAVEISSRAEAQTLSNNSPCPQIDGVLFRAFCNAGSCAKEETGAGCGQFGGGEEICDGSDDIRFAARVHGGFVQQTYSFTNPHGWSYMLVDGKCQFYSLSDRDGRIHSGTLSTADAGLLANDVTYGGLDAWDGMLGGLGADCTTSEVMKPGVAVKCLCDCAGSLTPPGMRSALRGAASWIERLGAQNMPFETTLRAMAQEIPGQPSMTPVAWPLDRPMADIPGLIEGGTPSEMSGARFDAADATALRALRETRSVRQPVFVRDQGTGTVYTLYVREELPDPIEAAFDAFMTSSN